MLTPLFTLYILTKHATCLCFLTTLPAVFCQPIILPKYCMVCNYLRNFKLMWTSVNNVMNPEECYSYIIPAVFLCQKHKLYIKMFKNVWVFCMTRLRQSIVVGYMYVYIIHLFILFHFRDK